MSFCSVKQQCIHSLRQEKYLQGSYLVYVFTLGESFSPRGSHLILKNRWMGSHSIWEVIHSSDTDSEAFLRSLMSKLRMRSTKSCLPSDIYTSGSGQAVLLPPDQWPSPDTFTVLRKLRGSRLLPGARTAAGRQNWRKNWSWSRPPAPTFRVARERCLLTTLRGLPLGKALRSTARPRRVALQPSGLP